MNIEYNMYTPICRKCDTMTTVDYDDYLNYQSSNLNIYNNMKITT